ncbi:cyclic nucleotide-binding domain-containing protein [bacterium]|nr:cyclic nucleotide-binding domain-containing protein [bacterium]
MVYIVGKGFSVAGPVREENEDILLLENNLQLFLVADGMGGCQGGARASQLVADTVLSHLGDNLEEDIQDCDFERWRGELQRGVTDASARIFHEASSGESECQGMGSTATALLLRDENGILAHVGDSRLYLFRGGVLHQLSTDHTVVNELLERGELTPNQAVGHPYAHVLTRAVGVHESVAVETLLFEVIIDDTFVLCSDGFTGLFAHEDELNVFLSQALNGDEDILSLVESRIEEVQADDNVTFAVLHACADEESLPAAEEYRREVSLKIELLSQLPLFRDIEMREIVTLVQGGYVHRLSAGEQILTEGETSEGGMYLILEGEVNISKEGISLEKLTQGAHFGEISLLLDIPRTATATACTEVTLLELKKEALSTFFQRSPKCGVDFLLAMSREFAERLTRANEKKTTAR